LYSFLHARAYFARARVCFVSLTLTKKKQPKSEEEDLFFFSFFFFVSREEKTFLKKKFNFRASLFLPSAEKKTRAREQTTASTTTIAR